LTHHDIVRLAAPLVRRGMAVDMSTSDRSSRYVQFKPVAGAVPGTRCIHSLHAGSERSMRLTRVLIHESGLASTLTSEVRSLEQVLDGFEQIPEERQIQVGVEHPTQSAGLLSGPIGKDGSELTTSIFVARSYVLDIVDTDTRSEPSSTTPTPLLQFVAASVCGLELRLDVSGGGGMPADLYLFRQGATPDFRQASLSDGSVSPLLHPAVVGDTTLAPPSVMPSVSIAGLPDDLLAVLGPHWRPMQARDEYWKCVLRSLGRGFRRTARAEHFFSEASQHLARTLGEPPSRYHWRFLSARWRVYVRRLKPLMLLIGLLALMPICWLLVSRGLLVMHPLTLGIAPLLMVGMLALTAREVPVIEVPPRPRALDETLWSAGKKTQPRLS